MWTTLYDSGFLEVEGYPGYTQGILRVHPKTRPQEGKCYLAPVRLLMFCTPAGLRRLGRAAAAPGATGVSVIASGDLWPTT